MRDVLCYTGLGLLFSHELDAMPNQEWRGIFLLNRLPDEIAMIVFVSAHVPLFALVIGLVASTHPRVRRTSELVIGAFLVLHGMLHALLSGRPTYEFASTLSHVLIFGSAACGLGYLALALRGGPTPTANGMRR